MSFKENLLTKIKIDRLANKVKASIGPAESGKKLDKEAMRQLLALSPLEYHKSRDLDLFVEPAAGEQKNILVLDNELPIYRTTIEDVTVRKSPLVKEMVKIGNIVKILKDSDVKISRKDESVQAIQQACIDRLDLSFNAADIDEMANDGQAALDRDYPDGVVESLELFAELLDYRPAPKAFQLSRCAIYGALTAKTGGDALFGPMVIYSQIHGNLKLIDEQISSSDKPKIDMFQQIAAGKQAATLEGPDVFEHLKQTVLKKSGSNPPP